MAAYYKNFILLCMLPPLAGCATAVPWEHPDMTLIEMQRYDAVSELDEPLNLEEMHLWVPPSEADIAMRRKRLAKLLRVSVEVDKVALNFRSVQEEGDSFATSVAAVNSEFQTGLLKPAKRLPPKLTKPGFGGFDTMQLGRFLKSWEDEC